MKITLTGVKYSICVTFDPRPQKPYPWGFQNGKTLYCWVNNSWVTGHNVRHTDISKWHNSDALPRPNTETRCFWGNSYISRVSRMAVLTIHPYSHVSHYVLLLRHYWPYNQVSYHFGIPMDRVWRVCDQKPHMLSILYHFIPVNAILSWYGFQFLAPCILFIIFWKCSHSLPAALMSNNLKL